MSQDVRSYLEAAAFLDDVANQLEEREAENSLILGLAYSLAAEPARRDPPAYLATVRAEGEIVLAAIVTPPFPLVLAGISRQDLRGVPALIDHLRQVHPTISGVTAAPGLAGDFADRWAAAVASTVGDVTREGVYELTRVSELPHAPGEMRLALESDEGEVCPWYADFALEAMGIPDREAVESNARVRVGRRELFVWEDERPRAIAARARPTRTTVTVNAVYTPPEFRRNGYATSLVAALSQHLLAEGFRACVLYTDLSNATSNSIYQRIGYRWISESAHIRFAGG